MNDRDQFAASALTGLLANGDFSMDSIPRHAFSMADAMLAERGNRNETSAQNETGRGSVTPEKNGDVRDSRTADTEPVAWAVWSPEWHEPLITFCGEAAVMHAVKHGQKATPLYAHQPQPMITDAERAALERTLSFVEGSGWSCETLRGLLLRLK